MFRVRAESQPVKTMKARTKAIVTVLHGVQAEFLNRIDIVVFDNGRETNAQNGGSSFERLPEHGIKSFWAFGILVRRRL